MCHPSSATLAYPLTFIEAQRAERHTNHMFHGADRRQHAHAHATKRHRNHQATTEPPWRGVTRWVASQPLNWVSMGPPTLRAMQTSLR